MQAGRCKTSPQSIEYAWCGRTGSVVTLSSLIPPSDDLPMNRIGACALGASLVGVSLLTTSVQAQGGPPRQTEGDAYTRYELLAPGSAKFRIIYEVTATAAGATYYFNPIRKGSVATDESVLDRATGKPLVFDVVGQSVATAGGVRGTDTTQTY